MNCCEYLKKLPIASYYGILDTKKNEIIHLEFFSVGKYISFNKLDLKTALTFINKDDLKEEIQIIKEKNENDIVFLTHRFYDIDRKHFIYVKARVKILKKDNNLIYFLGVNEDISREKENESIVDAIKKSPQIGMVIYDTKILLIDDFTREIFKKDITGFEVSEVIQLNQFMEENIKRRLKGENFSFFVRNFEIINFNNERKFVNFFSETIYFNKLYAGLGLIVDKTYENKYHIFENFLLKIGDLRLELFNNDKYEKKEFLKKLYSILNKKYECSIKYEKFLYKEEINYSFKEITILNNGKELFIPLNKGYIFFRSNFVNEFENDLMIIYKELQKIVNFTIDAIEKHQLLKLLNTILQKSYQWIVITDEKGNIVYVNDMVSKISGYREDELIGKKPSIFKSNYHNEEFYDSIWKNLKSNKMFDTLLINKKKNGDIFYLKNRFFSVKLGDEEYYVAVGVDVTKETELKKFLKMDKLTSLLNRVGFIEEAKKLLVGDNSYAVMIIDIRNFKIINEMKGNNFGDFILNEFAEFLKTFFYEEDLIARLGNDEFIILLKIKREKIEKIIDELILKIKYHKHLGINIGVSFYPDDGKDINVLIEKAFIALEYAKKEGENRYKIYDESLKDNLQYIFKAKSLIKEALQKDLFEFYFQPYYSIKEDKIVGAESLLRIVKNDEVITPDKFIDYAEESGLITEIEKIMFNKLDYYISELKIPLSVNFSASSFKNKNFVENLFKDNMNNLTLELTEREVASDINYAKEIFSLFKSRNLKIAIDDFGTGYSTLSYIKNLEFDFIKIDMSFIKNILTNLKDLALVKTIIMLAKEFNIKTIAEGVETKAQLEKLKEIGCDYIQGYLISKPLPLNEMKKFLNNFSGLN